MAETPTISVIICVFNGADVIGEQLNALAEQSVDVPWEVVVADNRSTDSTRSVVEEIARDFPVPLSIVDADEKQGVGYTRNCAAIASRGKFLSFCDADDRVGSGWLYDVHLGLRDSDLVGGALRDLCDPFDPEAPVLVEPRVHENVFGLSLPGCNFAVRREAYFRIGGFDEAFPPYGMDDVDFSARANLLGFTCSESPRMVVYFRQTRGAAVLLRKTYLSAQAEYLMWTRHPDVFTEIGIGADLRRSFRGVGRAFEDFARTRDRRHLRKCVRPVVSFWGHLTARAALARGRDFADPELLSLDDDPLR